MNTKKLSSMSNAEMRFWGDVFAAVFLMDKSSNLDFACAFADETVLRLHEKLGTANVKPAAQEPAPEVNKKRCSCCGCMANPSTHTESECEDFRRSLGL